MSTWIRKNFDSPGLTQVPLGPFVDKIRTGLGGAVMLMIDVSGSMDGQPIVNAIDGAMEFVREAVDARYHVGVMLWNTDVVAQTSPALDGREALALLATVRRAGGGNALDGPLRECHRVLDQFTGDRVVAIFGDGDLTPKDRVLTKVAEMKAVNIRFVTRGLGDTAAKEFGEITDEDPESVVVESVEQLATGIASMAASLKRV